jgi:pimeloyl-ACP methyl ester carboxylesterase
MADRFLVWLGAGMVTAGVTAAMFAGAAVASADSPPGSDANGTTSSESAKSTESKPDSDKDADKPEPPAVDPKDDDETATEETEPAAQQSEEQPPTEKKSTGSDTAEKVATKPAKPAAVEHKPTVKPAAKQEAEQQEPEETTEPTASAETPVEPVAAVAPVSHNDKPAAALKTATPQTAAVAFAAPASAATTSTAAAPPLSGLLSAIGTLVFNLYGFATRLVGGPSILPANSTVTVRGSTLRLDCANGYEVPADWYIPNSAEPSTRLIYLQHGFLASGPWYSHTAAALAEQTNSIVVAPTITSNFLSCDACWLGAPRMQQTVANLFADDNTALAESALAAGYTGAIPDRVVLVGHSLGGGLVAGTAGYMVDNGSADRLAGVVMLDGVGLDETMASSLEKVPDGIPIYQLAAPKYFWNQFGVGTDALLKARPDQFIGVTLVGGSHVDSMRGGNPLIQFSQQLVSGFSKPQNVAAAQVLMVGWINDMFAGNQDDGIYLDAGEQVAIDTPAGQATAVSLPNSLTKPFLLNPLQAFVALGNGFFTFEPTCSSVDLACMAESSKESVAA